MEHAIDQDDWETLPLFGLNTLVLAVKINNRPRTCWIQIMLYIPNAFPSHHTREIQLA